MIVARIQPEFARGLLAAQSDMPTGLHAWNGSDPARRFDVYRNNVLVSLTTALAEAFPVCCQLVGEAFFQAMAREYLRVDPPVSPVLSDYGDGFADFIASFPPATGLPYLPDVARLERQRIASFHAADAPLLAPEALQDLMADPERLAALRIALHPACAILRSRHAVVSLWAAHQHESEADRLAALAALDLARAEDALLVRPLHEVGVLVLPAGAAEFLLALHEGHCLGAAATAASEIAGSDLATNMALLIRPGVARSPAGA